MPSKKKNSDSNKKNIIYRKTKWRGYDAAPARKPKSKRTPVRKPDTSIGDAEFYAHISRFLSPIGELGYRRYLGDPKKGEGGAPKRTQILNRPKGSNDGLTSLPLNKFLGLHVPPLKDYPDHKTLRKIAEELNKQSISPLETIAGGTVSIDYGSGYLDPGGALSNPDQQTQVYAHEYTHRGIDELLKDPYIRDKVKELLFLIGTDKNEQKPLKGLSKIGSDLTREVLPDSGWLRDLVLNSILGGVRPLTEAEKVRERTKTEHRGNERLTRFIDNLSQLKYGETHNLDNTPLPLHGTRASGRPEHESISGGGSSQAVIPLNTQDNAEHISNLLKQVEKRALELMQPMDEVPSAAEKDKKDFTVKTSAPPTQEERDMGEYGLRGESIQDIRARLKSTPRSRMANKAATLNKGGSVVERNPYNYTARAI